jgi:hypothetical protein
MYEEFKSMVSSSHGSDNTISLWNDKCNTDTLHQLYPQLHSYAKNESISMASSRISNEFDIFSVCLYQPLQPNNVKNYRSVIKVVIFLRLSNGFGNQHAYTKSLKS